jgi:myosin V
VQRILESNPLLEAFGNAQTRRNDNSSRFGKYLQLQFEHGKAQQDYTVIRSAGCALVGSKCDVYLLEKNRVISHVPEERTFHIFYQLLAADEKTKAAFWPLLRNKTNTSFKYVGHTNTTVIEGTSDADKFQETLDALALVGIEGTTLQNLMQAICIVLQLGNLSFGSLGGDSDKSKIVEMAELASLATLAGVSSESLASSLTSRTFKSGKDTYTVNLNVDQAQEARDALAKEIYEKAFLWLVAKINAATAVAALTRSGETLGTIGLLDIFGFESFPHNRFEQLCINYANENCNRSSTKMCSPTCRTSTRPRESRSTKSSSRTTPQSSI